MEDSKLGRDYEAAGTSNTATDSNQAAVQDGGIHISPATPQVTVTQAQSLSSPPDQQVIRSAAEEAIPSTPSPNRSNALELPAESTNDGSHIPSPPSSAEHIYSLEHTSTSEPVPLARQVREALLGRANQERTETEDQLIPSGVLPSGGSSSLEYHAQPLIILSEAAQIEMLRVGPALHDCDAEAPAKSVELQEANTDAPLNIIMSSPLSTPPSSPFQDPFELQDLQPIGETPFMGHPEASTSFSPDSIKHRRADLEEELDTKRRKLNGRSLHRLRGCSVGYDDNELDGDKDGGDEDGSRGEDDYNDGTFVPTSSDLENTPQNTRATRYRHRYSTPTSSQTEFSTVGQNAGHRSLRPRPQPSNHDNNEEDVESKDEDAAGTHEEDHDEAFISTLFNPQVAHNEVCVTRICGRSGSITRDQNELVTEMDALVEPSPSSEPRRSTTQSTKKVTLTKYYENDQAGKPEPQGNPAVWANKRQQLCEVLLWYRAYQSGAYTSKRLLRGFLVDKEVGVRDYFGVEIIITTVGGGRESAAGETGRARDQKKNSYARACLKALEINAPVGLIAGQGNRLCPSQLPHYYNVLAWFHVTDVWCELDGGFKVWKVRFEKIDLKTSSWWAPAPPLEDSPMLGKQSSEEGLLAAQPPDVEQPALLVSDHPPLQRIPARFGCPKCAVFSKQIFRDQQICLNSECDLFFTVDGQRIPDAGLEYIDEFLSERSAYRGVNPGPLAPLLLTDQDLQHQNLFGIEQICKKGIVCPQCGCCSRRVFWTHWECENKSCDFTYRLSQRPVPLEAATLEAINAKNKPRARLIRHKDIKFQNEVIGRYEVVRYFVPGPDGDVIGEILHLKADAIINQQPNGPNDLFYEMQGHDFGLKRNPARQANAPGEVLTSHWAVNFGAPYKFGVATQSRPFSEAKPVIIKTVKCLTWAGQQALANNTGERFQDFNELLCLGYFEDTEIGFHDDGEKELGQTVASLSLGANATMSWRPKAKSDIGFSKNRAGTKGSMLQITLSHGDIMVMHGAQIQKHYEHAVTPHGKLRFALTCRYIRPETMKTNADREHTILAGTLPAWADDYTYDGGINAEAIPQPAGLS